MRIRIPVFISFLVLFSALGLHGQDFFWVGGDGDWGDANNWSLATGGAGGAGIPNIQNNVIFDANSFDGPNQEVRININAFCADMDWSGAGFTPSLNGPADEVLAIHGSLTFINAMLVPYEGIVQFFATGGDHTITSAGQIFFGDLIFEGDATWNLGDDLVALRALEFRRGTFNSNDHDIQVFTIYSDFPNARTFDFGTSTVRLSQLEVGNGPSATFTNSNLVWIASSPNFIFTGDNGELILGGDANFEFDSVTFDVEYGVIESNTDLPPVISNLHFIQDGEVQGNHVIPNWILSMGHTIFLENGSTQQVEDFVTGDVCDGLASLVLIDGSGAIATLDFDRVPVSIEGLYLRGVHASNASGRRVPLIRSRNGGNIGNQWDFRSLEPVDKYWVGGSGDWNDRNNWSDTSGGPGGACLPNQGDNIFFDDNSFDSPNDVVTSRFPIFVNNLTFTATGFDGDLNIPALYVNNDLTVTTFVNWNVPEVYLIGNDEAGNSSNTDNQFINAPNIIFTNITSESQREVNVLSDLNITGRLTIGGVGNRARFRVGNVQITTNELYSTFTVASIELNNSTIIITGTRMGDVMPVTIIQNGGVSGTGLWNFIGLDTGIESDQHGFSDILFSNENGIGTVLGNGQIGIENLEFLGDGNIIREVVTVANLTLSSGHTYSIDTITIFEVNDTLVAPGTICAPVTIQSFSTTDYADIIMSATNTDGMTYVEIRFVNALGGTPYSGDGSVDVGSNFGWVFPSQMENESIEQFLGVDMRVCGDSTVVLQPFDATEISQIDWNNGQSFDLTFAQGAQGLDSQMVIATVDFIDGCSLTDTIVISYDQLFDLQIGNDTIICEGSSLQLRANVTDADSYLWSTGESDISITVSETNLYELTAVRGACAATSDIQVTVADIEDFTLGPDTTLCEGTIYTRFAPNITFGNFEWSDGTSTQEFEIRDAGTYWLEVSQGECSLRDSLLVNYDPAINLDFELAYSICSDSMFLLDAGPGADVYNWNTGSDEQTIAITQSGSYSVEVVRGSCQEQAFTEVRVLEAPVFSLGNDTTICNNDMLILDASIAMSSDILWSDGSSTPELNITNSGTYWLEASEGGCSTRDSIDVVVQSFEPVFLGNDTTLCEGEELILDVLSAAQFYNWSNGVMDPTITITTPGTYSVEVIDSACTARDTIVVDYLSLAAVDLGSDTSLCEGSVLQLDATLAGITDYTWVETTSGDIISNDAMVDITLPGDYKVELSNGTCMTNAGITVAFDPAINFPGLGPDTTICDGETILYNFTANNSEFTWQDGTADPSYSIVDSGLYVVTVVRNNCTEIDSILVDVQAIPNVQLGEDASLCQGESITLNISQDNLDYNWSTGEITQSIDVSSSGSYFVNVGNDLCSDADTINVIFNSLPVIDLGEDQEICDEGTISIGDASSTNVFQWSNGETTSEILISEPDDYVALVTDTNGCTAMDTFTLIVNPSPIFNLMDTTGLCDGESADLEVMVPADRIEWSTGETAGLITVNNQGIVWAEASLGNCSFRDSTTVVVQSLPPVDIGVDTFVCSGSQLTLDATTSGAIYNWSTGESSPTILISDAGTYSVQVSVNGCDNSDDISITSRPTPEFTFATDEITICEGEQATLTTGRPELMTTWSTGETTEEITASTSGLYEATTTLDGCTFTDVINLNVGAIPVFNLGEDISECDQFSTILDVGLSNVDVIWNTGEVGSSIRVNTVGTYMATAMTNEGCEFSDELIISERECTKFSLYVPNAFNPLSLNEDNQKFAVSPSDPSQVQEYEMNIFDRWGNKLFTSNNVEEGWDGSALGFMRIQPGVYTYTIRVRYTDDFDADEIDIINGSLTLLR